MEQPLIALGRQAALAGQHQHRIAGQQADEKKGDDADPDEGRDQEQENAPQEEAEHGSGYRRHRRTRGGHAGDGDPADGPRRAKAPGSGKACYSVTSTPSN